MIAPGGASSAPIAQIAELSIAERADRIESIGGSNLRQAVGALRTGGYNVKEMSPRRLAWAIAWNIEPPRTSGNEVSRRQIDSYLRARRRNDGPLETLHELWGVLTIARRDSQGKSYTLLDEFAESVACESRKDWQPEGTGISESVCGENIGIIYRRHGAIVEGVATKLRGGGDPASNARSGWARMIERCWHPESERRFLGLSRISTVVCNLMKIEAFERMGGGVPVEDAPDLSLESGLDKLANAETERQDEKKREARKLCLRECLRTASPSDRLILKMRYEAEMSQEAIGKVLGVTQPAAGARIKMAEQRLQECLVPCSLRKMGVPSV